MYILYTADVGLYIDDNPMVLCVQQLMAPAIVEGLHCASIFGRMTVGQGSVIRITTGPELMDLCSIGQ